MERDQATKFMHDLLRLRMSKRGSDLFILQPTFSQRLKSMARSRQYRISY